MTALELRVLLEGVCAPERLLPLLRDFIVFEDDGGGALVKKMAGHHQFHAVRTTTNSSSAPSAGRLSASSGTAWTATPSPPVTVVPGICAASAVAAA